VLVAPTSSRSSDAAQSRAGRASKRRKRWLEQADKLDQVGLALLKHAEQERAAKAKERVARAQGVPLWRDIRKPARGDFAPRRL
jgi:hypothetical protein